MAESALERILARLEERNTAATELIVEISDAIRLLIKEHADLRTRIEKIENHTFGG